MNKGIVATDYKDKKDWNLAMQQFDLPAEVLGDQGQQEGLVLPPVKKSLSIQTPTWLPTVSMAVFCALLVGNLPLQSSHNAKTSYSHHFAVSPEIVGNQEPKVELSEPVALQETSLEDDLNSSRRVTLTENLTLPTSPIAVFSVEGHKFPDAHNTNNWKTLIVKANPDIESILGRLGVKSEYDSLIQVDKIKQQLEKISKGDIIRVEKIEGDLFQLVSYRPGSKKSFVVTRKNDTYTGRSMRHVIETRQGRTTLFVKHSLRYDANQENIPQKLIKQFVKIFDRDLQLTSDLKKGDRVTLVYEEIFHKGNKIASSDILAAELIHNKRKHRAIRYVQDNNVVKYLDPEGRDLNKSFKRHSLRQYKKISSHFGTRKHPISKRIRMHDGTDYAAPSGTPVTATGNGIITHIARKGGYGKTIVIKHRDGYTTLYGHMSKYGENMKLGKKVYLGDVIGYVGSTGYSTGPHLHYEFRMNGEPKNPEKVELPNSLSLTHSEQKEFKNNTYSLVRQLDVLQRFAEEKVDITSGFGG